MNYDWITQAIDEGGVMTVSSTDGKSMAMMTLADHWVIMGEPCDTLIGTLESLNIAISDED